MDLHQVMLSCWVSCRAFIDYRTIADLIITFRQVRS